MILGLLTISLNCPNAVNTFKGVWILTEMTLKPLAAYWGYGYFKLQKLES